MHGLFGSIDFFHPEEHFDNIIVHCPDMAGYGSERDANTADLTLTDQAKSVVTLMYEIDEPVWLLGHSVGGAVAVRAANLAPEMVLGVISVEGNFTLNDAFWCKTVSETNPDAWEAEFAEMQIDLGAWLTSNGIGVTEQRLRWAQAIFDYQPATTVQAVAKAVINETGQPTYLEQVRSVIERPTPFALLAGEHSASGWDVPDWVRAAASTDQIQVSAGHLMMLENPTQFAKHVMNAMS